MMIANERVIKNVDTRNINVKVDIPELKAPKIENVNVIVEVDGEKLDARIKSISANVGG